MGIPAVGTIGFATYLSWVLLTIFNPSGIDNSATASSETFFACSLFFLSIMITGLLVFALRSFLSFQYGMRVLFFVAVCTSLLGIVASLDFFIREGEGYYLVDSFLSVAAGVGFTCIFFLWENRFSSIPTQRNTTLVIGASCVLAGLIYIVIPCLREPYNQILIALLPLLSLAIFLSAKKRGYPKSEKPYESGNNQSKKKKHFVSEIALSSTYSIMLGFTMWYVLSGSLDTAVPAYMVCIAAIVLAGVLSVALIAVLNISVAYFFSGLLGPIAAIGLVLFVVGSDIMILASLFVQWVIYINCLIIHISNVSQDSRNFIKPRIGESGLILFFDVLMIFIGFGLAFPGVGVVDSQIEPLRCLIVLTVVLLLRMFCERMLTSSSRRVYFAKNREKKISGDAIPVLQHMSSDSGMSVLHENIFLQDITAPILNEGKMAEAIKQAAFKFSLSPRETEVFTYLARGHNARSVSEKLYVSIATIKTHTHNIYSKLEVHSQQELINYIEHECDKSSKGKSPR